MRRSVHPTALIWAALVPLSFGALVAVPAQRIAAQSAQASWQRFVDRNGGYKDNLGGYYNPVAGTYTDAKGGVVDNWAGYTYTDGSYKGATGDYWDAPTRTFQLTTGENLKEPSVSNAEARKLLRETAQEQGKFRENGVREGMIARILMEHPAGK